MFVFPVRVYYSDTDCGGIVYHGRYLDFAEHARTELLRTVAEGSGKGTQSTLMETSSIAFVVRSLSADYLRPGKLDDLLEVETSIEEAGHVSLTFLQTVRREGETLCTMHVRIACIDVRTHRPTPIPPWFVPAVNAL